MKRSNLIAIQIREMHLNRSPVSPKTHEASVTISSKGYWCVISLQKFTVYAFLQQLTI
jgi:hypothetical protein